MTLSNRKILRTLFRLLAEFCMPSACRHAMPKSLYPKTGMPKSKAPS